MRQRGCGTRRDILRWVADAMKGPQPSWRHGPDMGTVRRRAAWCGATLEDLDNDHAAAATRAWRAVVCRGAAGLVGVFVFCRRVFRERDGDQLSCACGVGLSTGAGQQGLMAGVCGEPCAG